MILPGRLRRIAGSLLVSALLSTGSGCRAFDALSECPGETDSVDAGTTVNGVDPEVAAKPLFTTMDGTLTWTLTAKSTPVHVTMARGQGPATASWDDCPDPEVLTGFTVPIYVQIHTDDGAIDTTIADSASEDPKGTLESIDTTDFPASDVSNPAVLPASTGGYGGSGGGSISVTLLLEPDGSKKLESGHLDEGTAVVGTLVFTH